MTTKLTRGAIALTLAGLTAGCQTTTMQDVLLEAAPEIGGGLGAIAGNAISNSDSALGRIIDAGAVTAIGYGIGQAVQDTSLRCTYNASTNQTIVYNPNGSVRSAGTIDVDKRQHCEQVSYAGQQASPMPYQ